MCKGQLAKNLFLQGKNCSQSVVLAFQSEINLPEDVLSKISLAFGGGFARQRLICGAVSGMAMAISYIFSNKNATNKTEIYSLVQQATETFKKQLGSIICADLIDGISTSTSPQAEERTEEYYKKRPCAEICEIAANIVQQIIETNKKVL